MTPRERVLTALQRKMPDKVPRTMGFNQAVLERVRDPEDYFGVELRSVSFKPTRRDTRFSEYLSNLPEDVEVGDLETLMTYSEWDYRPGSHEANPLAQVETAEELEAYYFPDITADYRYEGLREKVNTLKQRGFATVGRQPYLGGIIFEAAWRLRGFDRFLTEMVFNKPLASCLMDRLTERGAYNAAILAEAGVDILYLGDDLGTPTGLILSPDLWRELLKPRLSRVIGSARRVNPAIHVVYHSDGVIAPVLPDLIEIGVDILNPVQPEYMDPAALKEQYGDRLSFWGTVGDHTFMSFATPEQVKEEVRRRIETVGVGGGLIVAPAYDTYSDIPWENILAFFEAVDRYGTY